MGLVLINLCSGALMYKHVHPAVICQRELESPTYGFINGNFRKISGHQRLCVCLCACVLQLALDLSKDFSSVGTTCEMQLDKRSQMFNQTCLPSCLTCQEFNLRPKRSCGSNEEHSFICIGKLHWLFKHLSRLKSTRLTKVQSRFGYCLSCCVPSVTSSNTSSMYYFKLHWVKVSAKCKWTECKRW